MRVALGERGGFEDAALADGPDANVPLPLAQRLFRRRHCRRRCRYCRLFPDGGRRRRTGQLVGMLLLLLLDLQSPLVVFQGGGRRRLFYPLVRRSRTGSGAGTTGFGSAHFPGGAKLFDGLGQLAGSHAEVVAPAAVEVAAEAAESALERRRHRHFQEALAVPQQFDSWTNWMTTDFRHKFPNGDDGRTRMDRKKKGGALTHRDSSGRRRCNPPGRRRGRPG